MKSLSIKFAFLLTSVYLACYANNYATYKTDPYDPNTMLFGHELCATGCYEGLSNALSRKWEKIFRKNKVEKAKFNHKKKK